MAGVIAVSSVVKAEEETYDKSKRPSPTLSLHVDTNGQPAMVPKHSPIEHPEETVLARAERKSSMNATLTEEEEDALKKWRQFHQNLADSPNHTHKKTYFLEAAVRAKVGGHKVAKRIAKSMRKEAAKGGKTRSHHGPARITDSVKDIQISMIDAIKKNKVKFDVKGVPTREKAADVPYHYQGDLYMYTPENIYKRKLLAKNVDIRAAVERFWKCLDLVKNDEGSISRKTYVKMNRKLQKALAVEFDAKKARHNALKDWKRDTRGAKTMDFDLFFDSFFELADLWCATINPREYVLFLDATLQTIAMPVCTPKSAEAGSRRSSLDGTSLQRLYPDFPATPPGKEVHLRWRADADINQSLFQKNMDSNSPMSNAGTREPNPKPDVSGSKSAETVNKSQRSASVEQMIFEEAKYVDAASNEAGASRGKAANTIPNDNRTDAKSEKTHAKKQNSKNTNSETISKKQDLKNAISKKQKLKNANSKKQKLKNADSEKQDLKNADSEKQDLRNANSEKQDLKNADSEKQDLKNANSKKQNSKNAHSEKQDLKNADSEKQDLKNADSEKQSSKNADSEKQDLKNADSKKHNSKNADSKKQNSKRSNDENDVHPKRASSQHKESEKKDADHKNSEHKNSDEPDFKRADGGDKVDRFHATKNRRKPNPQLQEAKNADSDDNVPSPLVDLHQLDQLASPTDLSTIATKISGDSSDEEEIDTERSDSNWEQSAYSPHSPSPARPITAPAPPHSANHVNSESSAFARADTRHPGNRADTSHPGNRADTSHPGNRATTRHGKDRQSKDRHSKDRQSKDRHSKDRHSKDRQSKDRHHNPDEEPLETPTTPTASWRKVENNTHLDHGHDHGHDGHTRHGSDWKVPGRGESWEHIVGDISDVSYDESSIHASTGAEGFMHYGNDAAHAMDYSYNDDEPYSLLRKRISSPITAPIHSFHEDRKKLDEADGSSPDEQSSAVDSDVEGQTHSYLKRQPKAKRRGRRRRHRKQQDHAEPGAAGRGGGTAKQRRNSAAGSPLASFADTEARPKPIGRQPHCSQSSKSGDGTSTEDHYAHAPHAPHAPHAQLKRRRIKSGRRRKNGAKAGCAPSGSDTDTFDPQSEAQQFLKRGTNSKGEEPSRRKADVSSSSTDHAPARNAKRSKGKKKKDDKGALEDPFEERLDPAKNADNRASKKAAKKANKSRINRNRSEGSKGRGKPPRPGRAKDEETRISRSRSTTESKPKKGARALAKYATSPGTGSKGVQAAHAYLKRGGGTSARRRVAKAMEADEDAMLPRRVHAHHMSGVSGPSSIRKTIAEVAEDGSSSDPKKKKREYDAKLRRTNSQNILKQLLNSLETNQKNMIKTVDSWDTAPRRSKFAASSQDDAAPTTTATKWVRKDPKGSGGRVYSLSHMSTGSERITEKAAINLTSFDGFDAGLPMLKEAKRPLRRRRSSKTSYSSDMQNLPRAIDSYSNRLRMKRRTMGERPRRKGGIYDPPPRLMTPFVLPSAAKKKNERFNRFSSAQAPSVSISNPLAALRTPPKAVRNREAKWQSFTDNLNNTHRKKTSKHKLGLTMLDPF